MLDLKVEYTKGVSKKGNEYHMLKIKTGNVALDNSIKPIFLTGLQVDVLNNERKE